MRAALIDYIERTVLPRYASFDAAHREEHVRQVIAQAMRLADRYPVDRELVYAAAAYHDTGLTEDRRTHHLASGRIVRADRRLREWLTEEQIETVAQAVEDHRASAEAAPRTIYGRIVAEADRCIDPEQILTRTVQYGLEHYPALDREGHCRRMFDHLHAKYAEGGYLRLWLPDSPNTARLGRLRSLIRDEAALRRRFDLLYDRLLAERGE